MPTPTAADDPWTIIIDWLIKVDDEINGTDDDPEDSEGQQLSPPAPGASHQVGA
jgi:hypothetical protein